MAVLVEVRGTPGASGSFVVSVKGGAGVDRITLASRPVMVMCQRREGRTGWAMGSCTLTADCDRFEPPSGWGGRFLLIWPARVQPEIV